MKYLILSIFLIGCSKDNLFVCNELIPKSDGKPSILVIGDSISIGYFPYLKAALPNYQVVHNPCNARNTANTDEKVLDWLSERPNWYAIAWNNGLWDIGDFAYIVGPVYEANLIKIGNKIKLHTQRPLFLTTTQVPPLALYRNDARVRDINVIALNTMNTLNIPVFDLYAISTGIAYEHPTLDDVHFTEQGSKDLADAILKTLDLTYHIN